MVLGLLPPGSDKAVIAPALTGVFQKALANGVNNLNFGDLSGSLGQTMYQYNFQIPPYYTLLVRSLSVLEVGSFLSYHMCCCWWQPDSCIVAGVANAVQRLCCHQYKECTVRHTV